MNIIDSSLSYLWSNIVKSNLSIK